MLGLIYRGLFFEQCFVLCHGDYKVREIALMTRCLISKEQNKPTISQAGVTETKHNVKSVLWTTSKMLPKSSVVDPFDCWPNKYSLMPSTLTVHPPFFLCGTVGWTQSLHAAVS